MCAPLLPRVRAVAVWSARWERTQNPVFYNRVKGELEEALAQLPFEGLVIVRPSLLMGDRAALGHLQGRSKPIDFDLYGPRKDD